MRIGKNDIDIAIRGDVNFRREGASGKCGSRWRHSGPGADPGCALVLCTGEAQAPWAVPGGVYTAMERAGGIAVAGDPLLVIGAAGVDALWGAPCLSAVSGFIGLQADNIVGRRIVRGEAQQVDVPLIVPSQSRITEDG